MDETFAVYRKGVD